MPRPKSNEVEMESRITAVYQMLVKAAPRAAILQYAAQKWQASERSTDEYIARARALITEYASRDRAEILAIELERLDSMWLALQTSIYPSAGGPPDLKAIDKALRISEQRCKILGLYAPIKNEHTGANSGPIILMTGMSMDDL